MNIPVPPDRMLLYGIAIAAFLVYLPYFVVAYARVAVGFDMNSPRAMFDRLPPFAQRATWAHQNSFEVFMLFVAATVMVYITGNASNETSLLVISFLAARFGFCIFYILDLPFLRSPMWVISMVCIASLMSASFKAIGI
jgi:uncharacterized MAPEG superfamily protein